MHGHASAAVMFECVLAAFGDAWWATCVCVVANRKHRVSRFLVWRLLVAVPSHAIADGFLANYAACLSPCDWGLQWTFLRKVPL